MNLSFFQRDTASGFMTTVVLAANLLSVPAAIADERRAEQLWTQFRQTYPYHLQMIGLSDADKAGERILIVSEPPPWFNKRDVEKYFRGQLGDAYRQAAVKRRRVGVDGWVEDVVVRLAGQRSLDESWLRSQVDELHRELFGTAYKASALRLPVRALTAGDAVAPPNIQSRPGEINKWFFEDQLKLISLTTGEEEVLRTLLIRGRPDTYFSKQQPLNRAGCPNLPPT
jgi:hypothetical protein